MTVPTTGQIAPNIDESIEALYYQLQTCTAAADLLGRLPAAVVKARPGLTITNASGGLTQAWPVSVIVDGWGRPIQYVFQRVGGAVVSRTPIRVVSMGPDGQPGMAGVGTPYIVETPGGAANTYYPNWLELGGGDDLAAQVGIAQ